ncbi:MAG: GIY-YIG nuclease family protein [Ghiorsea sp.]|nr:GIY-YIG nuclease family protein [Ghiorsea sp.]
MPTATLKIFLAYGDPKRLRTAELSNWTGKAVSGPRSEFDKVLARDESLSSGVYFLTGIDPKTNKSSIYIGEAECIRDRVKNHLSKDFWNNITFFITKGENLTKAHIKYIEGRLIDIARSTERSVVTNNQGSGARLPESDREDMEVFLIKMQQILPVLGVEAFVQRLAITDETEQQELLYCNIKELKATGYLTPNGIVVLKGSQAVLEERGSAAKWPSVLSQRNKLIKEGVLANKNGAYLFTKDVEFSSPSSAAATIHGGSANGLTSWVNSKGKSLKQLQAE